MNRRYIYLTAVVALGFALRFVTIEDQPLWGDEGLTLLIALRPLSKLFLYPIDPTPGLYYTLHKLLIGPEAGLFAARSISLVAGTATIGATFALARASRIPALTAALLVALSFPLIDYSQEARAYSLLVLLVTLSGWAFVRWSRSGQRRALICFAALILLAFYTHFVSVFWIGPIVLACYLMARRSADELRRVALTLCVVVVLAIPELIRLFSYRRGAFSWLEQAGPIEATNSAAYVLLPFGLLDNHYWHLGKELTAIFALTCFALLAWRAFARRSELTQWRAENPAAAVALLFLLLLPLAIWLFGFFATPIFMPRTILIGVPGFLLSLALVLRFEHGSASPLMISIYALNLAFTGTVRPKEDWRPVAQLLASSVRRGDVVILCPAWKVMAFRHAMRTEVDAPLVIMRDSGPMLIERKLGSEPRWAQVYFEALRADRGASEAQVVLKHPNRIWRINSDCPY